MPNWCSNYLIAPKKVLRAQIKDGKLDFNMAVPMPKHQPDLSKPNPFFAEGGLGLEEQKKFESNNWYDWRVEHWGTKWNACDSYYDVNGIDFTTAWSPPIPWLLALSKKYPDKQITLQYSEEGFAIRGSITVLDGKPIKEVDLAWMLNATCPYCDGHGVEEESDNDTYIIYECDTCGKRWKRCKEIEILE
jgi:hypothetical protein